ncbi:MAG: hypothetical protein K2M95_04540 [Clostridiales bacterium]|nr:hypothetical protein [Clostridiales bacterium]
MQYEELQYADAAVAEVLFSDDKTRRCVITKSDEGFFSYRFETLEAYDEEWLRMMPKDSLPAYWIPDSGRKSVFGDMNTLMRELNAEPEYRMHFHNQPNGESNNA